MLYTFEEAKKRYPIGTCFKSLSVIDSQYVASGTYRFEYEKVYARTACGDILIYHKGEWAEIISTPVVDDSFKWEEMEIGGDIIEGKEKFRVFEKKDTINPSHYKKGKVECIDALESATVGKTGIEAVCTANAIKYLWRYEDKNGLEDVKKSLWYTERLIAFLEEKRNIC